MKPFPIHTLLSRYNYMKGMWLTFAACPSCIAAIVSGSKQQYKSGNTTAYLTYFQGKYNFTAAVETSVGLGQTPGDDRLYRFGWTVCSASATPVKYTHTINSDNGRKKVIVTFTTSGDEIEQNCMCRTIYKDSSGKEYIKNETTDQVSWTEYDGPDNFCAYWYPPTSITVTGTPSWQNV